MRDVPEYEIWCGVPAKKKSERNKYLKSKNGSTPLFR